MAFISTSREIKELPPLTEGTIQDILVEDYSRNSANMIVSNIYLFANFWETDFLIFNRKTMKATEIEIKISRSDFFNDKNKKYKHEILQHGYYDKHVGFKGDINDNRTERQEWNKRPNNFYYCVPDGLISAEEVPSYAGLIYIEKHAVYNIYILKQIKKSPKIHNEPLDVSKDLMVKFYYYWKNAERSLNSWKDKYESIKNTNISHIDY